MGKKYVTQCFISVFVLFNHVLVIIHDELTALPTGDEYVCAYGNIE